ncbi:endonuclease [Flavobacteriaceae bacterium TK19130]|nr:endonuclease [Thermobacterium salinum]
MPSDTSLYTIGFYNLENLFDTEDDPYTLDDDFTSTGRKKWNEKRFKRKVAALGKTISKIGKKETGFPPAILGVAEVENATVIEALVQSKALRNSNYGYVHMDSPDERGIDVALLYRKDIFEVEAFEAHTLWVTNEVGERDYTRDILQVDGTLQGQFVSVLINHWPSRRAGTEETNEKRIAAAQRVLEIAETLVVKDSDSRILIMGDFNDDPQSESIQMLSEHSFYNPMETLHTPYSGSLTHRGRWNLFDQILVSHSFLKPYENPFEFKEAKVYTDASLQEKDRRFFGNPFRTYAGPRYLGGSSDHFPIFALFSVEN